MIHFCFRDVPCVQKLLSTDYKTLVNAKRLLNAGRDRERLVECVGRECEALVDMWKDQHFLPKIAMYMASLAEKKNKAKL